ncbi:helix-turn-helix domain-containing protein [Enterococcus mundtii]|uniref:helix-turn-helix domain-containing protein n=1 Tax=Enterococcus mundtii TaxID=53346 RepID=UPI001CF4F112|nr:helix-turn-helix domain-containing protein [Enterococcus mundtii]MCA6775469.1 helix-turn-helix domain-containing protein [Enterococcus mundtii]
MNELQINFLTNKKTFRILKLLKNLERNHRISLEEVVKLTNSSRRTAIYDFKEIKSHFKNTITLTTSNKGYDFYVTNSSDYIKLKLKLVEKEPLLVIFESLFHSHNCPKTISKWAEELFMSSSALINQINNISPFLLDYGIKINKNPVYFIGKEINIRYFFHDFYYKSMVIPHAIKSDTIIKKITLELKEKDFFNDYMPLPLEDFKFILYITMIRFFNGNEIRYSFHEIFKKFFIFNKFKNEKIFILQKIILKYVNKHLSYSEAYFLCTILLLNRSVSDPHTELKFQNILKKSTKVLSWTDEYIKLLKPVEIEKTTILIRSFFYSILIRNKFSPILNQNTINVTDHIKKECNFNYKRNFLFISDKLKKDLHLTKKQVEDISANLTIFVDSVRITHWNQKKNIGFVLEGNYYIYENIKAIVNMYIQNYHNITFITVSEFRYDFFFNNQFDLIVTNYNQFALEYLQDFNYLLFNSVPSTQDWNKLFKLIHPRAAKLLDK